MKPPRALPILSVVLFAAAARGEIIERVIVKVNGDVVTQSEFEARQIAAVQQARVTPDQVEKFLRENNAHILQEAIDDLPVELVGRARGGEELAELAKAYAAAPHKASVSDLGVLRKGDLAPDVEKIAFALAPGQVSEPIPTPDGFRILKVVEKTEGSVVPYEDARAEIQRRLTQTRSNEQVEKYLAGLREKAIVDLRVREVPLQLTGPTPAGATRLEPAAEGAAAAAT